MTDAVRVQRDGPVARITLDRPERHNAMHGPMWTALREVAEGLAADPPRAVVLVGAGPHFCSGMDLSPANPLLARLAPAVMGRDADALRAVIRELKATVDAVAAIPVPVVAALEGSCLGGGLEVALAADLRVAGQGARFSLPETRWGMVPDVGGTVRLSRLVGRARAAQLALTAATIDAQRAESWGLVNEVVPDGQALARAEGLARQIAAQAPTATREALAVLRSWPGDDRFGDETEAGVRALLSGEVLEGLQAFAQKREARW
ncbi:MAG: enoyl-CoA hydratase/isomerase family protein [Myxococcales bacterium]|nr:enoyl-CoA hydratase/isomerase family protein [Myxococcales bacterium]